MALVISALFGIGCDRIVSGADADSRLRAGKLEEALSIYARRGDGEVDARQPAVVALGLRAPAEDWITTAVVVEYGRAGTLLDALPTIGLEALDLSFSSWTPMTACVVRRLSPPWRLVVARSTVPADPDPLLHAGPHENVPYRGGRIVGSVAHPPMREMPFVPEDRTSTSDRVTGLFARLDGDPPARLVTLVLSDTRGVLAIHLERRDSAWWTVSATDAEAAASFLLACAPETP